MFSRLVIAAGTAVVAILRAVGRALYEPDDGERVSTWSIPQAGCADILSAAGGALDGCGGGAGVGAV